MVKYVLIFFVSWSKAGGPATAEFADQTACENAAKIILQQDGPKTDYAFCVPYGEARP